MCVCVSVSVLHQRAYEVYLCYICTGVSVGLSAELRQRASDLQRALEITQQSRRDDERSLQAELRERDHLIHSISTERELLQEENRRLDTLLQVPYVCVCFGGEGRHVFLKRVQVCQRTCVCQEQKDTLLELKDRMDSVQRDRERDAEELRVRMAELRKSMEHEEIMKKELEVR